MIINKMASSVDPDEMAHYEPSGSTLSLQLGKIFGGTLNTPPIHIISRLTKHTNSYNLHVKRYPIHIIEDY